MSAWGFCSSMDGEMTRWGFGVCDLFDLLGLICAWVVIDYTAYVMSAWGSCSSMDGDTTRWGFCVCVCVWFVWPFRLIFAGEWSLIIQPTSWLRGGFFKFQQTWRGEGLGCAICLTCWVYFAHEWSSVIQPTSQPCLRGGFIPAWMEIIMTRWVSVWCVICFNFFHVVYFSDEWSPATAYVIATWRL